MAPSTIPRSMAPPPLPQNVMIEPRGAGCACELIVREVVEERGLFCALYSDRGSHFFHTPQAGEAVDKSRLTQVGRAMRELGIQMIAAYSPQARGRSERNFGTWQNRLPQELRLAGINTREAANEWLRERYIASSTGCSREQGAACHAARLLYAESEFKALQQA